VFTTAVVLTLGLGIGANAAVFADRQPPAAEAASGARCRQSVRGGGSARGNEDPHNVSWLDYLDVRDKSGAFDDLGAHDFGFVGFSADNRAERITISYVTSNFFSMLGVRRRSAVFCSQAKRARPAPILSSCSATRTGSNVSTATRPWSARPYW
jgi:hypothetical protein